MESFLMEDCCFDELGEINFQEMDSIMGTGNEEDFFTSKDSTEYGGGSIDEYLNLNPDVNPSGIISDSENKPAQQDVQQYHTSSPYYSKFTGITTESPHTSPFHHSDSGISSNSGSPLSDGNELSPFDMIPAYSTGSQQYTVNSNNAINNLVLPSNDDSLQFDFSGIEMDQLPTAPPLDIDFSVLLSENANDTIPPAIEKKDDGSKTICDQPSGRVCDASESSAKSTMSHDETSSITSPSKLRETAKQPSAITVDLPNFKPLVLSVEEKKLLDEEGVTIPTDLPLTRYEERILKKVRRKIRNKKSAIASRQKKKDYVGGLEARVVQCTNLNETLSQRVEQLEKQNLSLIEQLKRVHEMVKDKSGKTTQASTCIMVLLLSFGLFIAPSYGPFSIESQSSDAPVSNGHKTRKVLEHQPALENVRKYGRSLSLGPNAYAVDVAVKPVKTNYMKNGDKDITLSMDFIGFPVIMDNKHSNDTAERPSSEMSLNDDVASNTNTSEPDIQSSLPYYSRWIDLVQTQSDADDEPAEHDHAQPKPGPVHVASGMDES